MEDLKLTETIAVNRGEGALLVRRGKLVVLSGPDQGKTVVVGQEGLSMGSAEDNGLVLSDPTTSRHHVVIEESSGGYLVRDLGSTNGTLLNGIRIREAYLSYGACLEIGNTQLQFVLFEDRVDVLPSEKTCFGGVVGQSVNMRTIFAILERVAGTGATVILEGETGTGKEMIARAIHDNSPRADKPFIVFDCGAVARNLIESELFGHEKGAFTGAAGARAGIFEQADGGTVFLDELGELSMDLQPKLLRVLENREVKRVGGSRSAKINVRVIAATNRDLVQEVEQGGFREDLFYRLSVFQLKIPPLRERKEDIPELTNNMIRKLAAEYECKGGVTSLTEISAETLEILKSHSWPGNVRELRNVLSRALALGDHIEIRPGDLLRSPAGEQPEDAMGGLAGRSLEDIEKIAIMKTLETLKGNKTKAAKALGIAYSTLYEKLKKYGIEA
ncbi:MAG: FHA domain-containing protein [Deltaproteobacteria bacterium]|nr:FHA domain-containing protein [Deltaproteobacteria bacterium]